jgi:hypothetical protein
MRRDTKRIPYHGEVETLLLQLGERANGTHLVRFETLRVRAGVVDLDHARADIDAYELRDVRSERARDLTCEYIMYTSCLAGKIKNGGEKGGTCLSHKHSLGPRWYLRRGRALGVKRARTGLQNRPRLGAACQSRGRGRRRTLRWPLRARRWSSYLVAAAGGA